MIKQTKHLSSFKAFSTYYAPIIENELKKCVDMHLKDQRSTLIDAIKHSLLGGGKRIRPVMCLMSQYLFSDNLERIYPLACATEVIHTYSLIHDDLPCMDNDDFRRGKPTCHVKFGDDIATLAGDTLNSLAFEILVDQLDYDHDVILKLVSYFARALGADGLVGGQVLDILSTADIQDIAHLKEIHSMKTGALFKTCLVGPAILNRATEKEIAVLDQCAEHIGLLFQITDDILDVIGDKASLGKSPNKDQQMNKLTYMSLLGLEGSKKEALTESEQAVDTLSHFHSTKALLLKDLIQFILSRTS